MIQILTHNSGIYAIIQGRVQGVYFRASTKKIADSFGINGWVRNLADGSVEVMAFGDLENIKKFSSWIKQGPEKAEVSAIDICKINYDQSYKGFEIL